MKPILEYLLSKSKNKAVIMPSKEYSVDDIVDWIKMYKVKQAPNISYDPKRGHIIYAVNHDDDNNFYWVALRNNPNGVTQSILAKPRGNSFYIDCNHKSHSITFEEALELMQKMLENKDIEL